MPSMGPLARTIPLSKVTILRDPSFRTTLLGDSDIMSRNLTKHKMNSFQTTLTSKPDKLYVSMLPMSVTFNVICECFCWSDLPFWIPLLGDSDVGSRVSPQNCICSGIHLLDPLLILMVALSIMILNKHDT